MPPSNEIDPSSKASKQILQSIVQTKPFHANIRRSQQARRRGRTRRKEDKRQPMETLLARRTFTGRKTTRKMMTEMGMEKKEM